MNHTAIARGCYSQSYTNYVMENAYIIIYMDFFHIDRRTDILQILPHEYNYS